MKSRLIQHSFGAELLNIDHADGVWLTDTRGRRYLDGSSGAVVTNIGHSHPRVVAATIQQARRVTFTYRGVFASDATVRLANMIGDLTGFGGVWFVSSGSEAVEGAMQFALQYFRETGRPERQWFLSSTRGYHGNTLGALSLSGHIRRDVLGGLPRTFNTLPLPYAFRESGGRSEDEYAEYLLAKARAQFEEHADHLAGIVIEPVGGATLGATVPPAKYLTGLRALCTEFDVLFIADEVMTGCGRTGTVLASDRFALNPDIVATGKGLGAGYTPIAATLVSERILNAIAGGSGRILGGHTYGGNPFSAAIAEAVIETLIEEDIIERGVAAGDYLWEKLELVEAHHSIVVDHRGMGMLQGLEFSPNPDTQEIADEPGALTALIADECLKRGLLIYSAGSGYIDAAIIAPPLTITVEETDQLIRILDDSLTAVEDKSERNGL